MYNFPTFTPLQTINIHGKKLDYLGAYKSLVYFSYIALYLLLFEGLESNLSFLYIRLK